MHRMRLRALHNREMLRATGEPRHSHLVLKAGVSGPHKRFVLYYICDHQHWHRLNCYIRKCHSAKWWGVPRTPWNLGPVPLDGREHETFWVYFVTFAFFHKYKSRGHQLLREQFVRAPPPDNPLQLRGCWCCMCETAPKWDPIWKTVSWITCF